MPKLDGVRERKDWTFSDTLLSPEFGVKNVLHPTMDLFKPGSSDGTQFASDRTFVVNQIRASLFFEDGLNDPSVYGLIQMEMTFKPFIGLKPERNISLLHQLIDENKEQRAWPAFEIFYKCGPILVPARQLFSLQVNSSNYLVDTINELKGKKFMKLHVDGPIVRDVC